MIPTAAARGRGVDLISDLCDDLLLHILRFLSNDARDVVRTSALSTRWRGLWTRAPVLRLMHRGPNKDQERFNDFVHGVLTGRVHDIERLELHAFLWPGKPRADEWLRRAMRHTVGSLEFYVRTPPVTLDVMLGHVPDTRPPMDLPTATRVEKMSLQLDTAVLLLPPEVEFHALTQLTLAGISFSHDNGPSLGRLLSSPSCCPRLRKLTLLNLTGLHDLRLESPTLETLHLGHISVRRLDVEAPRLSLLHTKYFFMQCHYGEQTSLAVRAPALEKLETHLEFGRLRVQPYTIQLLHDCRPIKGHTLFLSGPDELLGGQEDDPMTEMPQLPGVTDLTIHFRSKNNHHVAATMTSLLARCTNLRYLHLDNLVDVVHAPRCKEGCGYCVLRGSWKDKVISLKHLRNVKFGGFSGQERCCLDMVQLLLESAPALERIVVTAKTSFKFSWLQDTMLAGSLESRLPCGRGCWTAHRASDDARVTSEYEWKPNLEMLDLNRA